MDDEWMGVGPEELLPIVQELTEKYTGRESASVPYETAVQLMEAVLYCIREAEADDGAVCRPAVTGQSGRLAVRERYHRGYDLVIDRFRQTNRLYVEIMKDFRWYGNRSLYDTVVVGMPEFFRRYDPRFFPQDTLLTLDYPILDRRKEDSGVNAIYRYLQAVRLEQSFLKAVPEEIVHRILISRYEVPEDLLFNLSGAVLRRLLADMLVGRNLTDCGLPPEAQEQLEKCLRKTERKRLEERLDKLLFRLMESAYPGQKELYGYLKAEITDYAVELLNAAEYHCLQEVL